MPLTVPLQTKAAQPLLWPRQPRHAYRIAWALWAVPVLVLCVLSAWRPLHRSVTLSYHDATAHWWMRENVYVGPSGMNYLPHFVILYTPFHLLPLPLCEVLWRLCAAAALADGLWCLVRKVLPEQPERGFFWATVVTMPLCMNSLRNGNANALFGGVVLLSIISLLQERWWLAVFLMVLATALKPLGVVLLLLAPLVYSPVRWRLPLAVLGMAVFPFLFGNPTYVLAQHREAWHNLQSCAVVTQHRFADINGILRTFGTELGPFSSKLVRVVAGALTAALWLWGGKRLRIPPAGLWLYALSAGYLMLFNPMNEENSYVILAPALGVWAVFFLLHPAAETDRRLGWVIVGMALSMSLLPNIVRPLFGNHFALIWHPAMTIIFLSLLAWYLGRSRRPSTELTFQTA